MYVAHAGFHGSTLSIGSCEYEKPPPLPFHTSRYDPRRYDISFVSVPVPLFAVKKSALWRCAASASLSQFSQWPVQQQGFVVNGVFASAACSQYSDWRPLTYGASDAHHAMSAVPSLGPLLYVLMRT